MLNRKLRIIVMVTPAIAIILFVLFLSIYTGISQSLGYFPEVGMTELSFDFYRKVFNSNVFLPSLKFTFSYSLIASLLSITVGTFLAMMTKKYNSELTEKLLNIPIIVPHMIFALIVLQLLSQSGLISRFMLNFGLLNSQENFPLLLFSKNSIGIILCYLIKEIPFVTLTVLGVLKRINIQYYEQAQSLGANKRNVFVKITLPLLLPNIIYVFLIVFIYSFGDYEVAQLLGPSSPKPLATLSYNAYTNPLLTDRPEAMVYNMIIFSFGIISTIFMIFIFRKMMKLGEDYD
ncbi:ABC transporter permease [Gemella cuniculi]|uniref:ABC transporter permease n=1 Tax=Gemella cuniculi TaxID=150240 RepID=UPI000416F7CE|nr:ABC transporter permease subunit [Gemella cuniculi]